MKNIKRRIISLTMAFGLILGVSSVPAHAEWQKTGTNWQYTNDDGTLKTGWLQDGSNWYFFSPRGQMVTGWVIDQGTWYYMREDGSLNNAKTTTTMPADIQAVYNEVQPFAGGLTIKYAGKSLTGLNDVFKNYGLDDKWLVAFSSEDDHGNKCNYYLYDPYNCRVFVLYSDLSIKLLGQGTETNSITTNQAQQIAQNYLADNNIIYPNQTFNVADEKNNSYFILCQEINVDHINTVTSCYVDKTTGLVLPKSYI
jgi:hypothetical protein